MSSLSLCALRTKREQPAGHSVRCNMPMLRCNASPFSVCSKTPKNARWCVPAMRPLG